MKDQFEISAFTATLTEIQKENNIHIIDNGKWVIPVYQRNYSWGEEQLSRFIRDLKSGFDGEDKESVPMFIGTMQFSEDKGGFREVIDGQQRLTTFLLLIDCLNDYINDNEQLRTDWLDTEVNRGIARSNLHEALKSDYESLTILEKHSPYAKARRIIADIFNEWHLKVENDGVLQFDRFRQYISTQIYFVCIETKASLSKTLQIFESINATGMDLNAGDLFKVNFYEYLSTVKGKDKSVFDEISEIYAQIDISNKTSENGHITDINDILNIYRYILISKYNLPNSLYFIGTGLFYERLFDNVLNNVKSEGFVTIRKDIELSLEDLKTILKYRINWHSSIGITAEEDCAYYFISWSRYQRYWMSIIILQFVYEDAVTANLQNQFMIKLSKILWLYSVSYAKSINECHRFIRNLYKEMFSGSTIHQILERIEEKILLFKNDPEKANRLNNKLNQPITDNHTHKNLICRLSAMLDEQYKSENTDEIKSIVTNLFKTPIDIEHIQSFHDFEEDKRQEIWNIWGDEINSIGNLVVLDSETNRSIGNNPFTTKLESYKRSEYKIVRNLDTGISEWTKDVAMLRKSREVIKINQYLFNEN
ncbi:DUF262 domain-containing HNH endonuclease family protein [Tenacibaculum maritimum]|uniref:DUF262 domain-containing protein n=1 Tax=Tenacibaculum maritimum TaxID=107401 RepID=UPI00387606B0